MAIAPQDFLLSGATVSGGGLVMDCRKTQNVAYLTYFATASAVIKLDASHNGVDWSPVGIFTATHTTATAQVSAYYPFVRGTINTAYNNATAWMHYAPALL